MLMNFNVSLSKPVAHCPKTISNVEDILTWCQIWKVAKLPMPIYAQI